MGEPTNERLAALTEAGTSVWLDELSRALVRTGRLERLSSEGLLRGVTANPAIFEKAITGSSDYDEDLAELGAAGATALEIYESLAIRDVRDACDVFRPLWEDAGHSDGLVSLEVDPRWSHDTAGTLDQVRRLWRRVGRPNAMIKIPATRAGAAAIEQATYEGVNVNVTLLFSVDVYRDVAEAYIRGMERRLREARSLDVHSVASFFVSRVDTEVDARLEAMGREDLQGIAGVANARSAYRAFRDTFLGPRFAELRHAGCPLQRPLWASTGVKDPARRDTMYVEELVGRHTVSTMPLATLQAVADHGRIRAGTAELDPTYELAAIGRVGVDLRDVAAQLLAAGIDAFEHSLERLVEDIESRRRTIVAGEERRGGRQPDPGRAAA